MKTTKRILVLLFLMVVTMGAWADPTMTLTLKRGNTLVGSYTMSKESENLWKYTKDDLPANDTDGSYNFSVAGVENESAIVTAGTGYFKISESKTVNFYATVKDVSGTNKVFSSCDGMRVLIANSSFWVIGLIPSSINSKTSCTYFNIDASGTVDFVPLADIIGTKWSIANDVYFNTSQKSGSLRYEMTTNTTYYGYDDKFKVYNVQAGVYKATVDYEACTVTMEKQNSYPLVIGDAGAATVVFPCEVSLPASLSAYKLEYESVGGTLNAQKLNNHINANTPVLINGPKGTYDITLNSCSYTSETIGETGKKFLKDVTTEGNDLYGVLEPHYMPQNDYVLQKNGEYVGFYKVNVANYTIYPFRCYVHLPEPAAHSLSIVFDDSETTGIADVKGQKKDVRSDIFNLSGQRVGKDYKGVVIKNGRKMIQK